MTRGWIGLLGVLAGCTDRLDCDNPEVVISSAGDAPGTVRAGTRYQAAYPAIAPLSDGGVVCLTCTGFAKLDRKLRVSYTAGRPAYGIAAGPDDTIYATLTHDGYKSVAPVELGAFEPTGALRWQTPLPGAGSQTRMLAVASGLYIEDNGGTMFFPAATGQPRPFPATDLLAARGDAVFTGASSARVDTVTIRRLDPTGTAQWERPWKAATPDLSVGLAVATPDGGVVILGHIRGAVDFGDRTLTGMPDRSFAFLVALDAVGATLWAYQLPELSPARMVLAPSGEIWLGGALPTDDPELGDAFLAVATSTGIDRIHHVDGPADQAIRDLEASPDGVAWLQVASYPLEGEQEAVMTIAGHTFRDPGIYVFAFVP